MQRASRGDRQQNFAKDYFIGGRSLGGFVLAMTTVATYSSVSTFVGGPGMAWAIGYGWLYMAIVQVVVIFLVLGIFGKKIAMVSRKIDAVTVVDVIRSRYQSDLLANISALVIVAFFCATMVAQFVGAAKLFEAVTGFSYVTGLTLFGLIVVFYTTVGGFKGVAITDAICAVAMIIGLFILFFSMLETGGGYEKIMTHIQTNHPDMLEPLSRGKMPISLYISQWLLVGVCTLALPQSVVRGISYKNTKALHNAMIIGTVVIGAMTLIATWIGVLSKGVLTDTLQAYGGSVDNIKSRLLSLAPWTPSGPASPSSVLSQQLFLPCLPAAGLLSAIIKDVYMHECSKRHKTVSNNTIRLFSMGATVILGLGVYFIAIAPPSVIWKINMFAFGGLETAFFWVLIFGLFWKKANRTGAVFAMAGGVLAYCTTMALQIKFFDLHQIVIGIGASLIFFLIGNALGKEHDEHILRIFFPKSIAIKML
ncbi:MAG: sodium/pantothenate symporter [Phascolarctobacterium faecium]